MERIVDYLAQEIEREEKLKAKRDARKAGKHNRIEAMLKAGLANMKAKPMNLDFLGD